MVKNQEEISNTNKKVIASDSELQNKILSGARKLTEIVSSTLGPRGRNVILQRKNKMPIVTKDGVTVSKFINFDDPFENVAAQAIKQAAIETEKTSGDGTTTSTVLAYSILEQSQKYLMSSEIPPIELKRGIDKTVELVVNELANQSIRIQNKNDIKNIATISANGDETIGELVATAVDLVGKDGSIIIEEGKSLNTSLDLVEGFRFNSGYVSSQFITDENRQVCKYVDPLILVTDYVIDNVPDILPILEIVARDARPLVIISENIEGQALAALIMNTVRGSMKVTAIKAPFYGEERRNTLQDICLTVGATFISRESGIKLSDVKLSQLGLAKSVESNKYWTTIVGGKGDTQQIEKRIDAIKKEIEITEDLVVCERLSERITRLASGVALIRVGGATEIEMIEKKHRIEDALEAVRSAQAEGVSPGGSTALIKASVYLDTINKDEYFDNEDQKLGCRIVQKAILQPFAYLLKNAGFSSEMMLEKVKSTNDYKVGYNIVTNELENLVECGVIDPTKVIRCSLQNAASVASTLLVTYGAVIEI
jgi:chaperonin GroEL